MTTWYESLPYVVDREGHRWRLHVQQVPRTWDTRTFPWKRLDGGPDRIDVVAVGDHGEALIVSANARRRRDVARLWGRLVRALRA